jgi:hypothetical protein
MAFPVTITTEAGFPGHNPPYKSAAGVFYAVVAQPGESDIDVYSATDPAGTWSLAASVASGANSCSAFATVQDGDKIHIAWFVLASVVAIKYNAFDMSDDTFDVTPTSEDIFSQAADRPYQPWISIAVRSDGDVIIAHNGLVDRVMGGDKERVDYARRESGTWTFHLALDAAGDIHYGNPNIALGTSGDDRMHIVWFKTENTTDPPSQHGSSGTDGICSATLRSNNTLSTTITAQLTSGFNQTLVLLGHANLVAYDDGTSQQAVTVGALNDNGSNDGVWQVRVTGFLLEDVNTIAHSSVGETHASAKNNEAGIVTVAVDDNADLHVLYSGGGNFGADKDIYYAKSDDNGATWDVATEEVDQVTCNTISGTVYERGGATVLAYLHENSGVIKYSEKVLIPAPFLPFFGKKDNVLKRM